MQWNIYFNRDTVILIVCLIIHLSVYHLGDTSFIYVGMLVDGIKESESRPLKHEGGPESQKRR